MDIMKDSAGNTTLDGLLRERKREGGKQHGWLQRKGFFFYLEIKNQGQCLLHPCQTSSGILLHGLKPARMLPEQKNWSSSEESGKVRVQPPPEFQQGNIHISWTNMRNSGIKADEAAACEPLQDCQQTSWISPQSGCSLQAPPEPHQIIFSNSSRSQQEDMTSNSVFF